MAVRYWPCLLTLRRGSRLLRPSVWGNFSASPTLSTRPTTWCGARSTSLWAYRNLLWQLSRDWNSHGSVMLHTPATSLWLSFMEGRQCCGQLRKCWMDNIRERTFLPRQELLAMALYRKDCNMTSAEFSLMSPKEPKQSRDWTELKWPSLLLCYGASFWLHSLSEQRFISLACQFGCASQCWAVL